MSSDVENLRQLCAQNELVRWLCARFGARKKKIDVLLRVLLQALEHETSESRKTPTKAEVIRALREIEGQAVEKPLRFGKYIEGRHGHETRFRMTEEIMDFGRKEYPIHDITTSWSESDPSVNDTSEEESSEDEFEEHGDWGETIVPLRENVTIVLRLPSDLTEREAAKLAGIVQHLYK